MTIEIITQIKELAASGKTKKEICKTVGMSWFSVYTVLTGKKYPQKTRKLTKRLGVSGLSDEHKSDLRNIAKNKSISQNRLLLTYIREAINKEPRQNKIYED
jgi:hypothetical protein